MQGREYNAPDSGTSGLPKGTASVPTYCAKSVRRPRIGGYDHCATITIANGGNGVVIVLVVSLTRLGSTTGLVFGMRRFATKAGQKNLARRGSVAKEVPEKITVELSIKAIANLKNLVVAYELIKSNPGNMTPGVDSKTLDGLDLETFREIQKTLRAGKYEFPLSASVPCASYPLTSISQIYIYIYI